MGFYSSRSTPPRNPITEQVMTSKTLPKSIYVLFLGMAASSCESTTDASHALSSTDRPNAAAAEDDEGEVLLRAADLPDAVRSAALARVPGLHITEAELEGGDVYCVHGMADGEFTEVEVDARTLEILEVEVGEDEHEGEGDDGPDDDDDSDDDSEAQEQTLDLDAVPAAVLDAARAAVPGLVIEGAETEGDGVIDVFGHAQGEPTEVEVDVSTLEVLEVEVGEDDDSSDDDSSDDDSSDDEEED